MRNFARASAGIAKARVDLNLDRPRPRWCWVTVAGAEGAQVVTGSNQYNVCSPRCRVLRRQLPDPAGELPADHVQRRGGARHRSEHAGAGGLRCVQSALLGAFSFDARDFAQPVFASELYGVIQSVPGVIASKPDRVLLHADVPPAITDPLTAQPAQISRRRRRSVRSCSPSTRSRPSLTVLS